MRLTKCPIVLLAIYLIFFCIFYFLLSIFGYTIIPINDYVINIVPSAIIVCLAILSLVFNKKEANTLFSLLLPIISILYLTAKGIAADLNNINIFVIHSLLTYICSLIIFFSHRHVMTVKIGLGIVYSFLLIPVSFVFFMIIVFGDFSENKIVRAEKSPNSLYLAEIIDNDQGALGGNTYVKITQQNSNCNILIGEIKKNPTVIYSGKWGEFNGMTIRWETDEILYINEKKYEIKSYACRSRHGWQKSTPNASA